MPQFLNLLYTRKKLVFLLSLAVSSSFEPPPAALFVECVVWPLPRIAEKSHLSVVIGLETILLSPASKEMMIRLFDLKVLTVLISSVKKCPKKWSPLKVFIP